MENECGCFYCNLPEFEYKLNNMDISRSDYESIKELLEYGKTIKHHCKKEKNMGNRAECPVCKAYSSNIYYAIHHEMTPCPRCQCPHAILVKWEGLNEELGELKKKRLDQDLINQIKEVEIENAILKTKLSRLEKILGYDDTVVKPILDAIKILNNQEVEDETDY